MDGTALPQVAEGENELHRRRFLRRLYVATDGNASAVRAVDAIASDVGVATQDGYCIARELARRGEVRWRGVGVVSVTRAGARGVAQHTRAEHRRRVAAAIRARDVVTVRDEFARLADVAATDPRHAVTTARSILATTLRTCIAGDLAAPPNQSLRQRWRLVQGHLGIAPTSLLDDEVNRVLRSLSSVVKGVAAFASAGQRAPAVDPLYARLAIRAASTLVLFVLEAWRAKRKE